MEVGDLVDARACLCSDKRSEAGDGDEEGVRLVECLRGRLLAERQASRDAKEEAELMGKRLEELERKLREEMKLRDKARKKLEFLEKKLGCLEVSVSIEGSRQPTESCRSSSSTVSMDAEQDMPLNVKQNHLLLDPGKNPDGLKSDIRSGDTSSSSNTRASRVFPIAPEVKELKKASRIGAAAFQRLALVGSNSYHCQDLNVSAR